MYMNIITCGDLVTSDVSHSDELKKYFEKFQYYRETLLVRSPGDWDFYTNYPKFEL